MKFFIDDLPVIFPYDYVYPEQYQYMCSLKRSLDSKGHGMLEMPSGTGKTISLLSLIIAYQQYYPGRRKLVYCSRTVPEIDKALSELKRLMAYRQSQGCQDTDFLGLGLTSRKNLCVHPRVSRERKGAVVDAQCRQMTASWVRNKARSEGNIELCGFYEMLHTMEPTELLPSGVYTLEDLTDYGRENGMCPYYLSRRVIPFADVIIYSFHYMIDPKVAELVSKEFEKNSIIVFDEAHNIDSICIDSLSIDINERTLRASTESVNRLSERVDEMKAQNSEKLQNEYERLVDGLRDALTARDEDMFLANPILPDSVLREAVPGNIRKADHFVRFLKRFVEYLKARMRVMHVVAETTLSFLQHIREVTYIERKPLRFCAERLASLVRTLEITDLEQYGALARVAAFATLCATYDSGFMVLFEPYESDQSKVPNPVLHLACLDAAIAIKPVFQRFHTVVITSGTLSPMDMYPKMLEFMPAVQESFTMSLARQCFAPLVVTRGSDQVTISSKFEVRNDPAVVRNYGNLLIDMARAVPDGIVAFFPSYLYMESIVAMWNENGVLKDVWKHKLIFVETPDAAETSVALQNYRAACDNGRGAVLLSVARGKVSEGIDFDHNYGRAVIMFGIPYQYTESRILKARLEFMRETHQIRENDFLTFDAIRHASQCIGRVLRGKTDYGLMVLADKRYSRADKRSKLPKWISACLTEGNLSLSTDMAIERTRKFLKFIAQPFEMKSQLGVSMWSNEHIAQFTRRIDSINVEADGDDVSGNAMEVDLSMA
ncbi:TFIIH/NER complex ATP-dependent 5'-3' DNA helicase subunit [Coemansia spiralis]|uniref:DNA 5'-3' helicase n=2 Tax=Coemansia TaxID=4863 RepID=A0A9W8GAD6_9FUNG|nr:putative transcription initiation factor TFIIH subunit [Coemansia spiralis]KAJ1994953.1 TFIIH/NER complex ATP-dependent 5'-3' DNA helicase subunit [Coemansia umbellata]KAJ2624609.1 TFIIH/NER complex ATP-dependent 5'-3' DNA helicase subunit [Coemansia sp. RSA 1358]KAJ2679804.1 TFIIH/NER complex ATP-dependent 5'-3' DNA helicase subunit [Coemansia spiralis]